MPSKYSVMSALFTQMLVCKRETRLFICNAVKLKCGKKFEMLVSVLISPK